MIKVKKVYLYLWVSVIHLICFFYLNVIQIDQLLDPISFYKHALEVDSIEKWISTAYFGSNFMIFLVTPLVAIFQNFIIVSLFFSILGLLPFILIIHKFHDVALKSNNWLIFSLYIWLVSMPSLHIWTSSLYKETIVLPLLLVVLMILDKAKFTTRNILFLVVSCIILFLLRMYVIPLVCISYFLVKVRNWKLYIVLCVFLLLNILVFTKIIFGEYNVFLLIDEFSNRLEFLNTYSKENGRSVLDLSNPYYLRMVYMMFRPLYFDAVSLLQMAASLENSILIVFFIFIIRSFMLKIKGGQFQDLRYLFTIYTVFGVVMWMFVAIYIYNYGLASRMKVMILPPLLLGVILYLLRKFSSAQKTNQI